MGLTHVTVEVDNLVRTGKPYAADFLVDTGAIDCLVPASQLEKLGVKREIKEVYELANGTPVEYDVGFARLSFMGEQTVAHVIFGPEHADSILGVVALENVGVIVDPVTRTLKRLHAKPLK